MLINVEQRIVLRHEEKEFLEMTQLVDRKVTNNIAVIFEVTFLRTVSKKKLLRSESSRLLRRRRNRFANFKRRQKTATLKREPKTPRTTPIRI
jgi:hypothetical protein